MGSALYVRIAQLYTPFQFIELPAKKRENGKSVLKFMIHGNVFLTFEMKTMTILSHDSVKG